MPKILIVEDDPMISEIYQRKFEAAGFGAKVAVNGKEVLKNVEENKFDMVLLDMVLPEMSGIEILKELKSGKYNPEMKVVMFSNLSDNESREDALKNGADGFIGKTQYSPSELVDEIKRMLNEFGEQKKNEAKTNGNNSEPSEKTSGKKKILFIEDEQVFIEMFGKKLEDEGYELEYAKNGAWGIKEAIKKDFDLIIMDIMMPAMTGDEMIRSLKMDDKTKNIPVIVLSASLTEDELSNVKKLGIEDFYLKTRIVPSDLARRVKELLNNR